MKISIIILSLFITSLSYACPKLSGNYDCKRFIQGYAVDYSIEDNIWNFNINGEGYFADGEEHSLDRQGTTGFYKSSCTNDNYSFYQSFTDNETGSIQTETSDFYIKNSDADTMYVNQVFTFGGEGGFVLRINDICKRN